MKKPAIVVRLGRTPSGWEILYGHGCNTLAEMDEYVAVVSGDGSTAYQVKVVDLDQQDMEALGVKS